MGRRRDENIIIVIFARLIDRKRTGELGTRTTCHHQYQVVCIIRGKVISEIKHKEFNIDYIQCMRLVILKLTLFPLLMELETQVSRH